MQRWSEPTAVMGDLGRHNGGSLHAYAAQLGFDFVDLFLLLAQLDELLGLGLKGGVGLGIDVGEGFGALFRKEVVTGRWC